MANNMAPRTRAIARNRSIAICGVFSALSVVLALTPFGYIRLAGAIEVTIVHIPTALATVLAGPWCGVAVGFVFGITSMMKAIMTGAPSAIFFVNPLVSVVPRMLFTLAVWGVLSLLNRIPRMPQAVSAAVAAAAGTVVHTALVLAASFIFFREIYMSMITGAIEALGLSAESVTPFRAYCIGLGTTLVTNGLLEAALAAALCALVLGSMQVAGRRKSKVSRLEK